MGVSSRSRSEPSWLGLLSSPELEQLSCFYLLLAWTKGRKPIYSYGSHMLWSNAGGPQK